MRNVTPIHRRRQLGRTLIEVMVAITIGLMLTAGVISIYGANRQTFRVSSDAQRLQAAGQLALDRLAYQIRMAGYGRLAADFSDRDVPSLFDGQAVFACSNGFTDPVAASVSCKTTAGPDAIAIQYQVEDEAAAGSGENRDCIGASVAPDAVTLLRTVSNRFYLDTSNGVSTLMCAGNGLQPAPLVPFVEDLRILVRLGTPFSRAEQVVEPEDVADWGRVVGVEICVQVVSESTGLTVGRQAGNDCRGNQFADDGRLRRTFSQVVTLRNRIL